MKEHPANIPEAIESIGPLSPREEFVLRLIYFRDDWEKNEGAREYSKNDGRAIWYLAIALELLQSQEDGILPQAVKKDVDAYIDWWQNDYGQRHEYPIVDRKEEIERTEVLIENVILAFNPDYDFSNTSETEEFKKRFLLHKTWFDGIPARIVHSTDGPWKIRVSWFLAIASDIEYLTGLGLISDVAKNNVDSYLDWWKSLDRSEGLHVFTKEDIIRGNAAIDSVLASLES